MAFIEGGTFTTGAGAVYPEETPVMQREVQDFYMDRHEVTNLQFAEFVEATGYITMFQRVPNAGDYPDIPAELLTPGSAEFVKLSQAVEAATSINWWYFTEGANWKNPLGPVVLSKIRSTFQQYISPMTMPWYMPSGKDIDCQQRLSMSMQVEGAWMALNMRPEVH